MRNKWRSSKMMSVHGEAFKRARLACKSRELSDMKRGEYGQGSQDWLAQQTRLSPRTVNELESGRATLKTVDAVSLILNIKGREYIQGYGEDFTTCRASGVVDFRAGLNGRIAGNETAYLTEPFLLTLDPLIIKVDDDFIDTVALQGILLTLSVGEMVLDFEWLYNVCLTDRSSTWLGDEEDISEVTIATRQPYQTAIMFKQDPFNSMSWEEFIVYIKKVDDARILLTLNLAFSYFKKQTHIIVSVEELRRLFELSFPQGFPYWVQPKALMV
ncbi:MAG: hypothetical protein KAG28_05500 [Cocleimonas sp.]|nr:hypothetical protein [Cocleimonas sp.]